MEEIVDIVDEKDNFVRKAPRKEMRQQALLHRVVAILVFDQGNRFLVGKRASNKDIYPGSWEIGIAETVISGENYEAAAERGLKEELGIQISMPKIKQSFLFGLKHRSAGSNVNYKVYKAAIKGKLKLDLNEISQTSFLSADEIRKLIGKGHVSPESAAIFTKYMEMVK